VWRVVSHDKPEINPLEIARFAHEGAVLSLAWNARRNVLVSAADDRSVKSWAMPQLRELTLTENEPDVAAAVTCPPDRDDFIVARLDGSLALHALAPAGDAPDARGRPPGSVLASDKEIRQAAALAVPGSAAGVIDAQPRQRGPLYRFAAKAGQTLVLETNAARSKSPLDTKVEVLTADGRRIERVLLQAVRDSYFTFRGKDSRQTNDFRVHNWEEMKLNQFLYASGEVTQLFFYPRGPDSGFDVYPKFGTRHTYFDTSGVAHALGEPCYIVEPHAPSDSIVPNGLPVFPVYFENDDDPLGKLGSDSRLTFVAPADGDYLARVSDARGFGGPQYKYTLSIREAQPNFQVRLEGFQSPVPRGAGKMFNLKADRVDGFDGEIEIEIANLPAGFFVAGPLTIQAGQWEAQGALDATAEAQDAAEDDWKKVEITAHARIGEQRVSHSVGGFGQVKLADPPGVMLSLSPLG
ncbi:MAG: hypothetical protein KDA41_09055, partial [Planctomycetales bacterium]|nr:hypothetical protein [Planctomycetales bacterium]